MITIVDYGAGNLGSIRNMLKKIGKNAVISSDPAEISNASKLILPGVGSYDTGAKNLETSGLKGAVLQKVHNGTPLLGICLGMQLLFATSEEGKLTGLDLIPGKIKKFELDEFRDDKGFSLRIPHMGWNQVFPTHTDNLFAKILEPRFYFVHSYYAVTADQYILGKSRYGVSFCCAVQHENVYGVQFHPEKSHKYGMQLLMNFVNV